MSDEAPQMDGREYFSQQHEHINSGRCSNMTALHNLEEWRERFPALDQFLAPPAPSPEPEDTQPAPRAPVFEEVVISKRRRNVSIDGVVFALVDPSIPGDSDNEQTNPQALPESD